MEFAVNGNQALEVLQRSVCGIAKCNVIEMTTCFLTVDGVIRIKT